MTIFDRFAEWVDRGISRPAWFVVAFIGVVVWIALGFQMGWSNDLYHLLLNSPTTALTFLMVALQANTNRRASKALAAKTDAIADALAKFTRTWAMADAGEHTTEVQEAIDELCEAVGLEEEQGTD